MDTVNSAQQDIIELPSLGRLYKTAQHLLFLGDSTLQSTGCCVWNGGTAEVNGWLNLKVSGNCRIDESPAQTLREYAGTLSIDLPLAGMMTAASMNSMRHAVHANQHTTVACIVTAGIENARRAGDLADGLTAPGTINMALVCNRFFKPAARIEALMLATEAKTAACYDLQIHSPVSGAMATGTGTDAICLLSGVTQQEPVNYCGKHTTLGEWIGAAAYEAVYASLLACVNLRR